MKARVCVDARLAGQAGIGTFLKSLLTLLSRAPTYELILLCRQEGSALLEEYTKDLIVMRSGIYTIREQCEYRKKIPTCDLFWAPHFNVPLAPIRAKKRVTTICDVYHLAHLSSLTTAQKIYAQLMYNAAFLLSDTITTISEFSKSEILKFGTVKPKKLEVISPPLDFVPSKRMSAQGNFLLYVGSLKPHKNLLRLVQAYEKLKPPYPLYLVGKKEGLLTPDEKLFQEVAKSPFLQRHVHILGCVTEERLKELYSQAYLFIFPSMYEGLGYPPLEAMASDCPVVASRVAAIPEVCKDAAEYIDPFSIDSLAEGINRLLYDQNRRDELIQKGRKVVAQKRDEKNRIMEVIDACCCSA